MTYYGKKMPTDHPEGCVAMTWKDAEEMDALNKENGWGFSNSDLLRLIADHMDAHFDVEDGNDPMEARKKMECIEWRLTDANFHTLCAHLHKHDYREAIKWFADNE